MRKVWLSLIPLFFLFISSISVCYGQNDNQDVDITKVDQQLGERIGVPEPYTASIGGLLMTMIVFLCFVMPTLLLRNRAPSLVMAFMVLAFCTAIGWLESWIMLCSVLVVTGMLANKLRRIFT